MSGHGSHVHFTRHTKEGRERREGSPCLEHGGVKEVDQSLLSCTDWDVANEQLDLALHLRSLDRRAQAETWQGSCDKGRVV